VVGVCGDRDAMEFEEEEEDLFPRVPSLLNLSLRSIAFNINKVNAAQLVSINEKCKLNKILELFP
jgi:hypothetical protein